MGKGTQQTSLKEAKAGQIKRNQRIKIRNRVWLLLVEIVIFIVLLFIGYILQKHGKLDIQSILRYF